MSGLEIERKFLVKKGDAYKSAAFSSRSEERRVGKECKIGRAHV